ncbi:dTDP-glucose 4,6-dehydratase [Defluviimonas aquaemixtae]|uniref:dTDP-glucose 4,6-dehydratase n=1 Tax=Albidovulum aquaemixtae TaxID=1542388 RepID=A0A2R8B688_9RHOB|nr:NAD(P)-dependent oxidoreductase [Defluviimonas aquaemixtae]SPH18092.1 dTDP-glucose 4,6-dehydratase [Defluviimonas aquaemixtae]
MTAAEDITAGRVLLTGASGLIGRQVAAPLRALGFEVVPVTRRTGGLIGDILTDPEGLVVRAEADHLIHLAWYDGPDRWHGPENLDWVGASLHLLRAFAEAGGKRAVMVGSCAEYDWTGQGRLSETSPIRPATLYGTAKAATGMAALAGAEALGLSLAWARPFFCYGPGEPRGRLFGDLIRGLMAGEEVDCTDGLQKRDFLHTEDIGRALAALLASPTEGAVNIGSGEAVAVKDMIGTLARALGREHLVRLGARARPEGDPPLIEADVTRLSREVGFRPAYDMERGILAVLDAEGALA